MVDDWWVGSTSNRCLTCSSCYCGPLEWIRLSWHVNVEITWKKNQNWIFIWFSIEYVWNKISIPPGWIASFTLSQPTKERARTWHIIFNIGSSSALTFLILFQPATRNGQRISFVELPRIGQNNNLLLQPQFPFRSTTFSIHYTPQQSKHRSKTINKLVVPLYIYWQNNGNSPTIIIVIFRFEQQGSIAHDQPSI